MRADAWKKLAQFEKRRNLPRFAHVRFHELLQYQTPHETQINKDLDRTFPEHEDLQHGESSEDNIGFIKLHDTLKAYAVYDPDLGYCQSLSYVAGCLNMYYNAEV